MARLTLANLLSKIYMLVSLNNLFAKMQLFDAFKL